MALLAVSYTSVSGHDGGGEGWGGGGFGGSAAELADGSQNMKQCRGNVWWVSELHRITSERAGLLRQLQLNGVIWKAIARG